MLKHYPLSFIIPALFILSASMNAQMINSDIFARLQAKKPGQGDIRINQQADITNMINLHVSQMRTLKGIKGYRVCIYYNSGQEARSGAEQERAKFLSRYDNTRTTTVLESPFFKVYVGDFRTKSEALKFLEQIRYDYPNAFIRDNITVNFPE
jgi:hypothetical protein